MPNILTIPVPNPDQLLNAGAYGAGAVVQVQRASAAAGPFADEGTVPIVAGTTSYTYYDTEGTSSTWYRVRYESADGSTAVSEWGTPFQSYTSLVSLADAQARVGDSVTQALIDEEEAWLASKIGPLTGERTETFFIPSRLHGIVDALYLSRRTNEVSEFTSDGDPMADFRLLDGYIVERHSDADESWNDPLVVTYTPNDETMVKGVIYDLLSYRSLPSNLQSVRIGAYSETYATGAGSGVGPVRSALLRKVLTSAGLGMYNHPFRVTRTARDRTLIEATGS